MFHLLIDTCVWLDLGQDYHKRPLLDALEELVATRRIKLILPRTILDEFARNKESVIKASRSSLSTTFKRVKEAITKFGDPKEKTLVLQHLNNVDQRLPSLGGSAIEALDRVEALFARTPVIETSADVKLRAAQRAIEKKAPFHHEGKNSIGDAILIETYADAVTKNSGRGQRFAFVSHNFKDYSQPTGNNQIPHQDIAGLFSKLKSLYFLSLKDALNRIEPKLISELMFVQEMFGEPRQMGEISEQVEQLVSKVWYDRHQLLRHQVENGTTQVVEKDTLASSGERARHVQRDIWEGALKAAAKVEKQFGVQTLGPYTDFEWGMLNGKLSALRWVLGEEWDMLDT